MDSAYEQSAKRAAVEAAERRYEHNQRVLRRAEAGRRMRSFLSVSFGLAVIAALALYLLRGRCGEISLPHFDFGSMRVNLDGLGSAAADGHDDGGAAYRARFADVASQFAVGEMLPWADAPSKSRPSGCPNGTVFRFMVPEGGSFRLFELTAGKPPTVVELTPFGNPLPYTLKELKESCGKNGCLIASGGSVYASGGSRDRLEALRSKCGRKR